MKILSNNKFDFVDIASILIFFLIPFEFIRISFYSISLSLTSIAVILYLFSLIFYFDYDNIKYFFRKKFLIFFLFIMFLTLAIHYNKHNLGIFSEWFLLPILFSISLDKKYKNVIYGFFAMNLSVIALCIFSILTYDFTYDFRLKSFYHSPNYLAMMVAPIMIFLSFNISKFKNKVIVYFVLFLDFLILLFTQSIFSIICVISVYFGYLLINKKRFFESKYVYIGIFVIILLSIVFLNRFYIFWDNIERSSIASRLTIWQVSKDLIVQNPLLGYGFGDFQKNYLNNQVYYKPYLEWAVPTTHNVYLMFLFSGGIFLLYSFLQIVFDNIFKILKKIRNYNSHHKLFFQGVLLSIFQILLHGLFDTTVFGISIGYIFWILLFV